MIGDPTVGDFINWYMAGTPEGKMTGNPSCFAAANEPIFTYRIRMVDGGHLEMKSPNSWMEVAESIISKGYLLTDRGLVPYHAITLVEPVATPDVPTVVPFKTGDPT